MVISWIDQLSICLICVAFCDLISICVVLVLFMLTASRSLFLYMLTWMIKLILDLVNFLKVAMANEFRGKVLKCARNQYANHVVQRCMECVPAQDIKFIFRSFCTKAKELSTTPYGCHIIQVNWCTAFIFQSNQQ
jgi:hypothetical protein